MAWRCWARVWGPRPHRLTVLLEQRQGFRRARPRPEEPPAVPTAEARPGPPSRRRSLCPPPPPSRAGRPSARRLVKPFLFAVGFTGSAFGSAAIWQYESLKSRVQSYFEEARADWFDKMRPQKRGDFRKQVRGAFGYLAWPRTAGSEPQRRTRPSAAPFVQHLQMGTNRTSNLRNNRFLANYGRYVSLWGEPTVLEHCSPQYHYSKYTGENAIFTLKCGRIGQE